MKHTERKKPLTFHAAIQLALHTKKLTRKQIDELKKTGELKKLTKNT